MKIAMVSGSYPPQPCGVGDYTERLVRELHASGMDVEVVTTASAQRRSEPYVRFEVDSWSLSNWRRAVKSMAGQSYDLVHLQYPARFYGYRPGLAFLTTILRRRLRHTPIVVTIHEFRITHLLRKLTIASIATKADAITVTAESERVMIERWMPWVRGRLHVVHLASTVPVLFTSPEERTSIRRRHAIQNAEFVLGFFGFLHPNKGIERLIRSFAAVHSSFPDARLMMMCLFNPSSNGYHATIERLVTTLNIRDGVIWTGYLSNEELSHHLACVDVAVFPFAEGVSLRRLSFMTALGHGVPTVTTSGQAPVEELHLHDRENVALVSCSGSAQELADRLLELMRSKALMKRLSEEGRRWAESFRWETVVQKNLEVYDSVINHDPHLRRKDL